MIRRANSQENEAGQVLVIFAFAFTALIAMGALLFAGAHGVAMRRQLQNTADAAALAAANLLVDRNGCSSTHGGTPRADIAAAARNSVSVNMPGYNLANVAVSCPVGADHNRYAVTVALKDNGLSFFGGQGAVAVSATAVNGQLPQGQYSVALLNPANPNWKKSGGGTGCPSYNINGGITATYEGSIMVNSICSAADGAAVRANNNSFSMNMINGSFMRIGGEYSSTTAGKINPEPIQNSRPLLPDPLAALIPPCDPSTSAAWNALNCIGTSSTLPTRSTAKSGTGQCRDANTNPCILQPGTYSNILASSAGARSETYLLRPGVYFIRGGGFSIGSGSGRIISIPAQSQLSDDAARAAYAQSLTSQQIALRWQSDCPAPPAPNTCGVLIYNAPATATGNWQTNNDTFSVGAQGQLLLRAYNPASDALGNGGLFETYKNVVVWQSRSPTPTSSRSQPTVAMRGGGCSTLSGTVYVPGALVDFGGGSCGSGGGDDPVATLQFIVWDLTLSGSNTFYFAFRADAFAIPYGYGLIR